ncbi:hypothetical protein D3C76_1644600 [compost metagenome]
MWRWIWSSCSSMAALSSGGNWATWLRMMLRGVLSAWARLPVWERARCSSSL